MLDQVGQALASIHNLTVAECEKAFNCTLQQDDVHARQYWSRSPELNIETLDVRIGQTGGIVVANFDKGVQENLMGELHALGKPVDWDIVSPPIDTASTPPWQRKWSVGYDLFGSRIYFGLEAVDGRELLLYASRLFDEKQTGS